MEIRNIGIIGYGEVGQALARGLAAKNNICISVFDIRFNDSGLRSQILSEKKQDINLEENLHSLIKKNELIISAVTCSNALNLAQQASVDITEGKIFVDLNTVAPRVKIEMGKLIEERRASFIEIAILGTIASYGYKSPMLACGHQASEFADFINDMGFKVTFLSREIGQASMMKMLRSVFSKGTESLLFEMLIAAERCNLLEPVMSAVVSHMDKSSFLDIAETWITTNVIHAKRRTEEMDHVIETLNDLEVDPIMSAATRERLRWCSESKINSQLKGKYPLNYQEVIKTMSKLIDS
jgi:3-hydroxyisobutyrate dehydrogenase-like beta-hydroxyacid dehydrogenase